MHIKIKEPFWSAGQRYGWSPTTGIGIDIKLLKEMSEGETLEAEVKGNVYRITKEKARSLHDKYHALFQAKGGVNLVVLPLHEFEQDLSLEI